MLKFFLRWFLSLLLLINFSFLYPSEVSAKIQINQLEDGTQFRRSLESLRDLDYQSWQVVAYPTKSFEGQTILRIVGYPGTMRFDHPTSLQVYAGRHYWELKDVTQSNIDLIKDPREAAAEFELEPLLNDLKNNHPLRLILPEVFAELPIPPYVVNEWRSLLQPELLDE